MFWKTWISASFIRIPILVGAFLAPNIFLPKDRLLISSSCWEDVQNKFQKPANYLQKPHPSDFLFFKFYVLPIFHLHHFFEEISIFQPCFSLPALPFHQLLQRMARRHEERPRRRRFGQGPGHRPTGGRQGSTAGSGRSGPEVKREGLHGLVVEREDGPPGEPMLSNGRDALISGKWAKKMK